MRTIELQSCNIFGKKRKKGVISIDTEQKSITTPSGKTFYVIPDYEYTYKISRKNKTIHAIGGIDGLCKFLDEVNYPPTPEAMGWASDFTDLCFFTEVLFESPSVLSSVPPDIIFKPSFRIFLLAFSSLSCIAPQDLQVHSLSESFNS